jgi:hypothetical protein
MITAAVRRALPALLVLHALRTAFALAALGPLYHELAAAMDRSTSHATATPLDAALALEVIARAAPRMLPGALAAALVYALIGPWLQQAMLHALAGARLRVAAIRAARRYLHALATRSSALIAFALIAAASVLALKAALYVLPASVALEASTRGLFVAFVLAAAFVLATSHDIACAALTRGARLGTSVRAAVSRCTRAALRRHLIALATAATLVVGGELASRVPLPLPYALGPGVVLAVQQALLFTALCARAAWLAHALELGAPSAEAAPAAGTAPDR